jgi:hypothetical protein
MPRSKNSDTAPRPGPRGQGFTDRPGETYGQASSFEREWHDDSGTPEQPRTRPDLGPAAELADDIRDAASSAARAVKQQAAAVVSEIGNELGKTAEEQVSHGADAIRGFARAIEAAGSELEKISPQLAHYVNDSAGKIREVSNGLSNRQVDDLIRTATDFARSQPAVFVGAAIATGFALARFLKSSAKHEAAPAMMPEGARLRPDGIRGARFDERESFHDGP